ncbi:dipeptidyl-peptidase-like protein V precursor [Lindgomyces ingoldianus]|uniref:Dipeptidyl-peptidase-like protein V n=1 Tax=Lindgomyces ingoldianus TaxID=673940 RepID=A0ACB6QMJ6_9PLEO|nr:dipeptidyl-peptidase-like protein V precursor [Lindgomyces ingoldianus]KAF2468244.1 dipeptidyl-peptidase-like protein V precursor [Lindgomyces ingoldianus]
MTIRATKFTPEVLLSAPRRSAGIPNSAGSKILYSVSTYSFADHSKKSEIRILDVESQQTSLISDESSANDPHWLGDDAILLLNSGEDGTTRVRVGGADDFSNSSYVAGTIPAPAGNVKVHALDNGDFAFAISAKATPDGDFFNPETAKKPHTSGRLYKTLFVRHWDHYVTENRSNIWLGKLQKKDGKFELSKLQNALKGTSLESPIEPFGGTDHFDISSSGLIFTAKDPGLNPALHTKTNIYLVTAPSFWNNIFTNDSPSPIKVDIYGFEGASTSPVFSPDGKKAAFLSMKKDGYESDKNHIFIIPDISRPSWVVHALASEDGKGSWDRSPSSIIWSPDRESPLYLLAEDHGRVCLFAADFKAHGGLADPEMIVKGGSIIDVQALGSGDLFFSSTSLIDNSLYSILPLQSRKQEIVYSLPDDYFSSNATSTKYISSQSKNGAMFGLSRKQIDEIHWPGAAKNTSVHAWVIKPSHFNSKEKYPLAYLIHGGPQGAWEDGWSTRWNPAVFAEQGYVVICPNPTGSTGYGQAFTDAIGGEWGGLPYEDLVKGFSWIEKNLHYVDTKRAVALGASYGGYMMNWIQGHPLGRKFLALVTHDGVFSMTGQLASEELYFPFHDLKGPLWKNRESWAKWDPSAFTENWATPHLIIHNELDYRLTISEGLAAFHTLQSRGVESQFLTFPDENHWVVKPENSLLWHETVLDWINPRVGLPLYSESRKTKEWKVTVQQKE